MENTQVSDRIVATLISLFGRTSAGFAATRQKKPLFRQLRDMISSLLFGTLILLLGVFVMIDQREVNVPSDQAKPPANAKEQPEKPETPHRFDDWAAI
ncbi:MAG: hypothetical protein QNJ20_05070 [Paracoccaceae bacterium]|nr:hypothetical protein [Paracoccaceae bacterium]